MNVVADLLAERTGLWFGAHNIDLLERGLGQLGAALGLPLDVLCAERLRTDDPKSALWHLSWSKSSRSVRHTCSGTPSSSPCWVSGWCPSGSPRVSDCCVPGARAVQRGRSLLGWRWCCTARPQAVS